jgi:hypothetical protein
MVCCSSGPPVFSKPVVLDPKEWPCYTAFLKEEKAAKEARDIVNFKKMIITTLVVGIIAILAILLATHLPILIIIRS